MKHRSHAIIAALAIALAAFTACENNDVSSNWDATYDSAPTQRSYDSLMRLATDSRGDIVMIGSSILMDVNVQNERLLVVKYNASGQKVWEFIHEFSYQQGIFINDYSLDSDNNIYVSGVTNSDAAAFLVKISPAGSLLWQTVVERDGWLTGAIVVKNGTVFWAHMDITQVNAATGAITSTIPVNRRMNDLVLDSNGTIYVAGYDFYASYSAAGTQRWLNAWGASAVQAVKLVMAADNSLYAACGANTPSNTVSVFKINTAGTIVTRVNESIASPWGVQLALDKSGNVIIAASTDSSSPVRTVVKYNAALAKTWKKTFTAASQSGDLDQMIVDTDGDIYLTGGNLSQKISAAGSLVVSEKDKSLYADNCIALSPDNTKMYVGTYADNGEITLFLSQYTNN